jgi:hypothetical protein
MSLSQQQIEQPEGGLPVLRLGIFEMRIDDFEASRERATSYPTGTPPRGRAITITSGRLKKTASFSASRRPASRRSRKFR